MKLATVCSVLLAAATALGGHEGTALAGDPPPLRYNAFDLGSGRIPLYTLNEGEHYEGGRVLVQGSTLSCVVEPLDLFHIVATPPKDKTCSLFSAPEPGNFTAQIATSKPTVKQSAPDLSIEFDKGFPFSGSILFDGKNLTIGVQLKALVREASATPERPPTPGEKLNACLAYYQVAKSVWQNTDIQLNVPGANESSNAIVPVPFAELAGNAYLMLTRCPDPTKPTPAMVVLRLSYPSIIQTDDDNKGFADSNCKDVDAKQKIKDPNSYLDPYLEKSNDSNYVICIDQANAAGLARILRNKRHYVATHSFGRLAIRHWKTVVPVVSFSGSAVGLPAPGLAGAAAAGSSTSTLIDGQGLAGGTTGDRLTSTVFIPPHAPGTLHMDVKFVDATDNTKVRTITSVDLIVDQGYAGALRLGLGHVWGTQERSYSALQRTKDSPKEIVEQSTEPTEVVVGYSLYFDGFSVQGRTYNLLSHCWYCWFWRHAGIFAGFGALSYANGNVDFLRSIHVGPELEISRNISVAATVVYRRNSVLSGGLQPGGPAPEGEIPTSSRYDWGLGLVITFAPEFAKFATSATSGGSK